MKGEGIECNEMDCLHWCMSLTRREDRRFVLERTLPAWLVSKLKFIDALDGAAIPAWKAERKFSGMKPSSWALRLTKALALRAFLRSGQSNLCLYEDDVILDDAFSQVLTRCLGDELEGWDCVFLGGVHSIPPEGDGDFQRCRATFNNQCVLYSRKGARKVLSLLLTRWDHAWSDRELEAGIKRGDITAYCPRKFVAWQRQTQSDNWLGFAPLPTLYKTSDQPKMLPDDAHVLYAAVKPGDNVLEWGSGGSTMLLARRVGSSGSVTSIEYQWNYYLHTRQRIEDAGFRDYTDLHYVPPLPQRDEDSVWRYMPEQMKDYVNVATNLNLKELDVVLVDGRERIMCALDAAKVIKAGGLLLIHDFWSRTRYRVRLPELLAQYTYRFETPEAKTGEPQGFAVFERK